ncbi:Spo0B domain-containing protein [Tepidibacter hydrothermalis]|uniref:Spo0B domain-containing protein n=1 Tax=Tepidibacter hydrothermalis TaxID=3036126 RepID=A0ABY8EF14_9FIRM|nr:Spo0B domain-containing protein [Tepidibacter hydrothermalis]WFD11526.1 Spo0B domain-containing protein [Tepidibacter hydrothermalis]
MKKINDSDLEYWNLIEDLLKQQRHDYLNEIQIIFGYIKLNKIDEAVEYINKIRNEASVSSKLSNLSCIELYLMLEKKLKKCRKEGVNIDFNIYTNAKRENFKDRQVSKSLIYMEKALDKIFSYMNNNNEFEEYIIYIEETSEYFILKVALEYLKDIESIKKELDSDLVEVIIEEDHLIYEIELE